MTVRRGAESRAKREDTPSSWWLEFARIAGETVGRASIRIAPRRPSRSTVALVRELGELVSEHAQDGYASLEDEPRFWALVDRLHARPRRPHAHRGGRRASTDAETADAEAADAADVDPAPVDPGTPSPFAETSAGDTSAGETPQTEAAEATAEGAVAESESKTGSEESAPVDVDPSAEDAPAEDAPAESQPDGPDDGPAEE